MAEPQPADPKQPGPSPKLVALADDARPEPAARPEPPTRQGASWWIVGLLALLLVLALGGLAAQTQHAQTQAARIAQLEGQVAGLESSLTNANEQLATYDRTLALVRGTVSELFSRIADLNALVQVEPRASEPAAR